MIRYLKKWIGMTQLEREFKELQASTTAQTKHINLVLEEIKSHTRVDADIGFRSNNTIILTGVYHKRAFVKFYDLGAGEFTSLVEQLKHMKSYALVRHIDAPPSFRATFNI